MFILIIAYMKNEKQVKKTFLFMHVKDNYD